MSLTLKNGQRVRWIDTNQLAADELENNEHHGTILEIVWVRLGNHQAVKVSFDGGNTQECALSAIEDLPEFLATGEPSEVQE